MMRQGTEAQFQQQVVQLAGYYGWSVYHTHDSRRSHKGWPDIVLCRPPEVLFVELKGMKTRLTPEQKRWLADLTECGLETHLWRPTDFDELHVRLARGRARNELIYRSAA